MSVIPSGETPTVWDELRTAGAELRALIDEFQQTRPTPVLLEVIEGGADDDDEPEDCEAQLMPSADDLIAALESPGPLQQQPAVRLLLEPVAPPKLTLVRGGRDAY
jgi:hypothetical protein